MKGRIWRRALGLMLLLALLALAGCREFPSLGPLEEPPVMACTPGDWRCGGAAADPLENRRNEYRF